MKKILFVFGTRPEAIKFAPLIKAFEKLIGLFTVKVCVTGQHRELLDQVLNFFSIKPDYDLAMMKPSQDLFDITSTILSGLKKVYSEVKPDIVFVQGDTTTAFTGALAAYYNKIPVAHIEAGLRSYDNYSPFPEEVNRKIISAIAQYHFAATEKAAQYLKAEGIVDNVYITGNTVIDALRLGIDIIQKKGDNKIVEYFNFLDPSKKVILITGHRRESFGKPFENICMAIKQLAIAYENFQFVYPVHLNPNVRTTVFDILNDLENVYLIEPLDYPYLIWLMNKSYLVLTDSGGIQEEAPSLGKPVLVMRDVTERMEGVEAGTAILVGTDTKKIADTVVEYISNKTLYKTTSSKSNPYGDGYASERILSNLSKSFRTI